MRLVGKISRAMAREIIELLDTEWTPSENDEALDADEQLNTIALLTRALVMDYLHLHRRYSSTGFAIRRLNGTEEQMKTAAVDSESEKKTRNGEVVPYIRKLIDMTFTDVLTEPSGRIDSKLEVEAMAFIKT